MSGANKFNEPVAWDVDKNVEHVEDYEDDVEIFCPSLRIEPRPRVRALPLLPRSMKVGTTCVSKSVAIRPPSAGSSSNASYGISCFSVFPVEVIGGLFLGSTTVAADQRQRISARGLEGRM